MHQPQLVGSGIRQHHVALTVHHRHCIGRGLNGEVEDLGDGRNTVALEFPLGAGIALSLHSFAVHPHAECAEAYAKNQPQKNPEGKPRGKEIQDYYLA